jgi:hypothetical protein
MAPVKEVQRHQNPVDTGHHQATEIASSACDKMCAEAYQTADTSFSLSMLKGVNDTVGASSKYTRVAMNEPSESLEVTPISAVIAGQKTSGDQAAANKIADEKFNEMVA